MHEPEDGKVVEEVLAGDVEAYAVLVLRYERPIYNLMYRMTTSHADAMDLS